jgi:DNA (cytosine-5)-methyltransferase 1
MTFVTVAPTLDANFGRLQGHDNQHIDGGAGHFVAHSLRGEGFDASEDGTGRRTPIVPVAFSSKDYGNDATDDLSPTLRSMGHDKSHANGGGQMAIAFAHQGGGTQTTLGYDPESDTAMTLQSHQTPAVAFMENQRGELRTSDIAGQITCGGGKPGQGYPAVHHAWQVRRLTPTECHRLQGFPDDHCAIQLRGKIAADGPQYKALGNSWAKPNGAWIIGRIAEGLAS